MSAKWPMVPLGEVLRKNEEYVDVYPDCVYREVTVKLWGRGVVLRRQVEGAELASARRVAVKEGHFILSRIDARNGAMGIVPPELDGAVVSNDFPSFWEDQSRVHPQFLGWMSRTSWFVDLCRAASEGTTNRVRLQEERLLGAAVPLPPLPEQNEIVCRLERIADGVENARRLRRESISTIQALNEAVVALRLEPLEGAESRPLAELASKIGSGSTPPGGRAAYPAQGVPFIRSQNIRMRRFEWKDIAYIDEETHERMAGTEVQPGDVLLNITGASIGRVACAPADLPRANVSQHVAIIRPLDLLEPRFLMYWLSQPATQRLINDQQKGATRQGFTKAQIEALSVPVLPIEEQHALATRLDSLTTRIASLAFATDHDDHVLGALMHSVLSAAIGRRP